MYVGGVGRARFSAATTHQHASQTRYTESISTRIHVPRTNVIIGLRLCIERQRLLYQTKLNSFIAPNKYKLRPLQTSELTDKQFTC